MMLPGKQPLGWGGLGEPTAPQASFQWWRAEWVLFSVTLLYGPMCGDTRGRKSEHEEQIRCTSTILWMWLSGPADLGVLGKHLCFFHLLDLILTLPGLCLLWVLLPSQEKPFSLVIFQPGDSCHTGNYGMGRVFWPLKGNPVANSKANARIFQYPQGAALLTWFPVGCWTKFKYN